MYILEYIDIENISIVVPSTAVILSILFHYWELYAELGMFSTLLIHLG